MALEHSKRNWIALSVFIAATFLFGMKWLTPDCSMLDTAVSLRATQHNVVTLTNQKNKLRKQLGTLSCQVHGIGPTGGYCFTRETSELGGNNYISSQIADILYDRLLMGPVSSTLERG